MHGELLIRPPRQHQIVHVGLPLIFHWARYWIIAFLLWPIILDPLACVCYHTNVAHDSGIVLYVRHFEYISACLRQRAEKMVRATSGRQIAHGWGVCTTFQALSQAGLRSSLASSQAFPGATGSWIFWIARGRLVWAHPVAQPQQQICEKIFGVIAANLMRGNLSVALAHSRRNQSGTVSNVI